jgi:hypothetical protein
MEATVAKRKLTNEEKIEIREQRRKQEEAQHPGSVVRVTVADETDANGKPIITVTRTTTRQGGFHA